MSASASLSVDVVDAAETVVIVREATDAGMLVKRARREHHPDSHLNCESRYQTHAHPMLT